MESSSTAKALKGTVSENGEEMTIGQSGFNGHVYKQLEPFRGKKVKVKLTLEIEVEE